MTIVVIALEESILRSVPSTINKIERKTGEICSAIRESKIVRNVLLLINLDFY